MSVKRLALNGILTAIALTIFVLEAQLPVLVPLPGIKLGLSNLVTLFALIFLSPKDALLILVLRCILGSFFAGNPSMLFYSLSGGLACLALETLLIKLRQDSFLWGVSAMGAMAHNTTQLLVAAWITHTTAVFWYLPYLLLAGLLTGLFTGLCIWYVNRRFGVFLRRLWKS